MLANDVTCNTRNVYADGTYQLNLYGSNVEVDYRRHETPWRISFDP
jgi:glycosylphosphatidylinositol transamidase (GPIT) subunit GPI8